MYSDAQRGIAFEIGRGASADSPRVAIMVHPTGKTGNVDFADRKNVNWVLNLATTENVNEILRGSGIDP